MYATCRVHLGVTDFCSNPTSTRECRDWACPVPERHSDINIQTLPLTLVTASLSLSSEPHIEMSFLVCQNVCALALMSCDLNWCFCHSLIVLFLFLSSYIALIYFLFFSPLPSGETRRCRDPRPALSPERQQLKLRLILLVLFLFLILRHQWLRLRLRSFALA